MTIKIAYSPCPNDTFIFDAMVHQKIDTEGLEFEPYLADVEELNHKAMQEEFDVTKLSFHAMAFCLDHYQLLQSGSALGSGVGPLLIAKREFSEEELDEVKVAIPGKYTTANFLLSLAYPRLKDKKELLFSDIEAAVIDGEVDAGLIIHENRFTYQEKGLIALIDLGNYWEQLSSSLIPLGGIVCRRGFDAEVKQKIDRVLQRSIQYAFDHPESSQEYVKTHAQEMDEAVVQKHINLYVNEYSLALGEEGRAAVKTLFHAAVERGIVESINKEIFVE